VGVRPSPPFTEAHSGFRAEVRAFVESELRPHAAAWEAAEHFPDSVFATCAAHGLLGLKYERRHGGAERGHLADAIFSEELARCGSGGVAAGIGAHTSIATPPVWKFGTEAQQARYLAPAIAGERIGALAITEPDAGSDVAAIRTRAERVDGGWLVNGAKTFITNGVRAHFYVTAVKTGAEGGHGGLSFLLVDAGEEVRATALKKLGWVASDTAEVVFDDVFVPEEHALGPENKGFYLIMANFQWERLLMALGAVGSMRAAVERLEADLGGGGRGQATRHRVAELALALQAGEAVTYHALRLFVSGQDAVREVTMAKLQTQRACVEVHAACLELLGDDPERARALRDARLGPIGGGTDEIMREILGKTLGL
jgi:acyl-CoA dehydrogenase